MKYVMKQISPDHIKNASTKELLELWELTKRMKCSEESSIVRGWLVDELETRDPESIGAWMESEDMYAFPKDFIKVLDQVLRSAKPKRPRGRPSGFASRC